ncbi:MAG TPA: ribosomal protein S18-alanine N-acetyltransferase [Acidimicrobiales bacterium]|nr:ribosomal protein S18-alanine N-acetyltransferase [Acidimicrobiales bacterium]
MSAARLLRHRVPAATPLPPRDGEKVEIAPMRRQDVAAVVAIEREIFPEPWSAGLYLSELARRATRQYWVATSAGAVVGYAGCMLVAGECHVTTLGVDRAWQGRRIGAALFLRLVVEARATGATALTLEVRVSNLAAQRLYRWFGLAPVGVRKDYYAHSREDGLVMWVHDVDSQGYGAHLDAVARALGESTGARRGRP